MLITSDNISRRKICYEWIFASGKGVSHFSGWNKQLIKFRRQSVNTHCITRCLCVVSVVLKMRAMQPFQLAKQRKITILGGHKTATFRPKVTKYVKVRKFSTLHSYCHSKVHKYFTSRSKTTLFYKTARYIIYIVPHRFYLNIKRGHARSYLIPSISLIPPIYRENYLFPAILISSRR